MKLYKFLTLICVFCASTLTLEAKLSPEARLRKLSISIRGIDPDPVDWQQLSEAKQSGQIKVKAYFDEKIATYLKSNWANQKLSDRLIEDFRVAFDLGEYSTTEGKLTEPTSIVEIKSEELMSKQLNYLFQNNKTWDHVLVKNDFLGNLKTERIVNFLSDFSTTQMQDLNVKFGKFAKKAEELGYKLQTQQQIENAISEYKNNFRKFNPNSELITDVDQALTNMIRLISPAKNQNEIEFLSLLTTLKVQKFVNLNGQKIEAGLFGDFFQNGLSKIGSDKDWTLQGFNPKTNGVFTINLTEANAKKWACSASVFPLQNNFKTSINSNSIVAQLCPLISPYLSDIENAKFLTKLYNGDLRVKSIEAIRFIQNELEADEKFNKAISRISGIVDSSSKVPIFSWNELTSRYSKTIYSQSAAFHRIYMCDEMKLVALVDANKKTQDSLGIFKFLTSNLDESKKKMTSSSAEEAHVKGDCVNCHRKLDPIKDIFSGTADVKTWVYDDFSGKEHKIEYTNTKGFFKSLLAQPQYVRCQVEKFWNWYIGEDVPKTEDKMTRLMEKYRQTDSNPKALISFIVNLEEFDDEESVTGPAAFSVVRPLLQRCNSCHQSEAMIPSFTQLPMSLFGNSEKDKQEEHVATLKRIIKFTNLLGENEKAVMPPDSAGWKVSKLERQQLLQWIWDRSHGNDNNPTILISERDLLFQKASREQLAELQKEKVAVATFRPTWKRYLENYDIVKILGRKLYGFEFTKCYEFLLQNKLSMGHKDPASGKPLSDQPTVAYRQMFNKCVNDYILKVQVKAPLYSSEIEMLGLKEIFDSKIDLKNKWTDIPENSKILIADNIISHFVGKNVLTTKEHTQLLKYILYATNKSTEKDPNLSIQKAASYLVYVLLNREEFLTY